MKHMFGYDKIEQTEKNKWITKPDIYIILGIFIVALLFLFGFHIFGRDGSYAVVSYDGEILQRISLFDIEERYYLITEKTSEEENFGDQGKTVEICELTKEQWSDMEVVFGSQEQAQLQMEEYNIFICKDGRIQMLQSSCPDQICVHHTEISKTGESIICLPHKLVIEISGTDEDELDGVVY